MALPMILGPVPVASFELLGSFEPMSRVMKDSTKSNKTIGFCSTARLSSLMVLVIFKGSMNAEGLCDNENPPHPL